MKLNFIDQLVGFFSAEAAQRRAVARMRTEFLLAGSKRGYEGASKGRRTAGWKTSSTSANAEIMVGSQILRDRSRDMIRNNAWAARAKNVLQQNVVGTGILAKIEGKTPNQTNELMLKWQKWSETTEIDFDGRLNLYGLQSLAVGAEFESGEYLIRRIRKKNSDNLTVPLQIQFLEIDFLDTAKNEQLKNGGYIAQGIQFDNQGRRVGYWLFSEHPGGSASGKPTGTAKFYPTEDVIHGFKMERPGQIRGVPRLAPVMLPLMDLDQMQDAQLVGQKTAACFSVFITEAEAPLEASDSEDPRERVEPGMIEILPPGKDVKIASPNAPSGYDVFVRTTLQRISAGIGVPYEALTGDLSNVNFSSGRMGWLEFQRAIEVWRWQGLIPQTLDTIAKWFLEAAALGQESDFKITWTPPRREMIDPSAEVASTRDAIRAGLKTFSEAVRELGNDPAAHFAEYAKDIELIDSLKLTFDSDPRKMSKVGFAQTAQTLEALAGIEQPAKPENKGST